MESLLAADSGYLGKGTHWRRKLKPWPLGPHCRVRETNWMSRHKSGLDEEIQGTLGVQTRGPVTGGFSGNVAVFLQVMVRQGLYHPGEGLLLYETIHLPMNSGLPRFPTRSYFLISSPTLPSSPPFLFYPFPQSPITLFMLPRHEACDTMHRGVCRVGVCASPQASSVPASVLF